MSEVTKQEAVRPPWFAGKQVPVLMYRINRRPRPKGGNLFADEPNDFLAHLADCLLFGEVVTTEGRGSIRHWRLGNRVLVENLGAITGWVGYTVENTEEQEEYDDSSRSWRLSLALTERRASAPFVVVAEGRYLYVAKHPTFAEGTIPAIFEDLLNRGEQRREAPTTLWAVEPVLDEEHFQHWLERTAVLDTLVFHVKLPNPDAADSFRQIDAYLKSMRAGELQHKLTPRDPDIGLNKEIEQEPISQRLMEMTRRGYARIRAKGKTAGGTVRVYDQRRRVHRQQVRMPASPDEALGAVVRHAITEASRDE